MAFVHVIFSYPCIAELFKDSYTAYTEHYFLAESVFLVAAIKPVGYVFVIF